MRLVERHIIKTSHQFYKEVDDLAWRSKNLYNYANYLVRQSFIEDSVGNKKLILGRRLIRTLLVFLMHGLSSSCNTKLN